MGNTPCKNTFDMTVRIVINAIREKMSHGTVTEDDLGEIEKALIVDNAHVEAFCHSVHERCMSSAKLDLLIPPRTNAYGRVMVQPLEQLIDKRKRRMSQKQLANYFHMLSSILGRETYEKNHDSLAELMRSEIRDHGSDFDWERFYNHPQVATMRLETLATIAKAFKSFEQRMIWFINIMESSFEHPENPSEGTLQFTEHQSKDFLLALFGEFINPSPEKKDFIDMALSKEQRSDVAHLVAKLQMMK